MKCQPFPAAHRYPNHQPSWNSGWLFLFKFGTQHGKESEYVIPKYVTLAYYFELKIVEKTSARAAVSLLCPTEISHVKVPPCTTREEGTLITTYRESRAKKLHKQTLLLFHHFTTASPHPFILPILTHLLFLCPKGRKASCSGHFFEFHMFVEILYVIKFVFLLLF